MSIDFLRDVTKANIFVNWKALEAAGIDKNAPVTLRLNNVSFAKVLDLVLNSVGGADRNLGYTVDQGVISIRWRRDIRLNGRLMKNRACLTNA